MEGARKGSPANSTAGGCPASLLLHPAIKIYSLKLPVHFFRPVWVKFGSDDFLRVLYSFFLPFLIRKAMWQLDVTAKAMLSVQCSSAIRRLFLALPPATFKSLIPAVSTDSDFPVQPSFFSCRLSQQTLPQMPEKESLCLKGNHSLQPSDCSPVRERLLSSGRPNNNSEGVNIKALFQTIIPKTLLQVSQ